MGQKNKGTFYKEQNGTWTIDTKIKIDGVFKHFKRRGYATLTEAKEDYENAKQRFIDSKYINHSIEYVNELVEEYLSTKSLQISVGTYANIESIIDVFIAPHFYGSKIKNSITKEYVNHWYSVIVANNTHSIQRKNFAFRILKEIIRFAYAREYINARTYQSCDVILVPMKDTNKRKEKMVWNNDEKMRFFKCIDNKRDYLMFYMISELGLRICEFLALQVKCIEFDTNNVIISQQCELHDKMKISNKLKTKSSYRTIIMTPKLAKMLKEYIADFNLQKDDFIFFSQNNKHHPISTSLFTRLLAKYVELAKVPLITPHAFRHMRCLELSSIVETGEEMITAASMLGHSPSVFMNTYANHKSEEKQKLLLAKLGGNSKT